MKHTNILTGWGYGCLEINVFSFENFLIENGRVLLCIIFIRRIYFEFLKRNNRYMLA